MSSKKRPRVDDETILKDCNNKGEESSSSKEGKRDRTRNIPNKFRGIRRKKSSRWGASIQVLFNNRKEGLIDVPDENKGDYRRRKNSSTAKRPRVLNWRCSKKLGKSDNGEEKSSTKEDDLTTGTTNLKKFVGAYPRHTGVWYSNIRDPFTRRKIHLGDFDSPEEASNAWVAKKKEFSLKLKQARSREQTECAESDGPKLENSSLNNNGKASCSKKEVDPKLRGVQLRKSGKWGAKILDPFKKRDIWLGTFDTQEEASIVYAAKRLEFLQRKEGRISIDATRPVSESGKSVEQNDGFESSSYSDCQQREPKSLSLKRPGVINRKRQSHVECETGISGKQTESTISSYYEDDQLRLAKSSSIEIEPPNLVHETLQNINNDVESSSGKEADLARTTLNKFRGVRLEKSGRWGAKIYDQFSKREIWLGTFDTRDEASNVCAAKRLEFLQRKEGHISIDGTSPVSESGISLEQDDGFECESERSGEQIESTISSYHEEDKLTPVKSSSIEIKPPKLVHETFQTSNNGIESSSRKEADLAWTTPTKFRGVRQEKSGRWAAITNDPFTKRQIWLGTFDTPEEASNVYAAKRLEFYERKKAQICMDLAQLEYEPVKSGQQFDVSQISEPILIDSNGFLMGEFSSLDDELRIL